MRSDNRKLSVLFLCTGNSCRSQMAQGWASALKADVVDAYSAGTHPQGLNPLAVLAMNEVGVDISRHTSKRPEDLGVPFDVVVTVCDSAHESCPFIPGARIIHVGFDDPPRLARGLKSDDEAMPHYRRVRDEIRRFVETLPNALTGDSTMTTVEKRSCCSDSCCPPDAQSSPSTLAPNLRDAETVRERVREGYAKIAQGGCCGPSNSGGGCCGATAFTPDALAKAIGYTTGELAISPDGANMGLSCGNPTALASLCPGEVVLDLGAGGGFDCFVAGPKVGASGRVIGVDMTPDMLTKARRNTAMYREQSGLDNVEFRLGEIESLPVADASVDVVISNCVLNLSPDKPRAWREIARVLRPGGRVAVSDLALVRPLPEAVKADVEALVGCVAGAVLVEESLAMASAAGLCDIVLTPKPQYIDAMTNWQDPLYRRIVECLPAESKPSDYVTSLDMSARKR